MAPKKTAAKKPAASGGPSTSALSKRVAALEEELRAVKQAVGYKQWEPGA